MITRGRTMGGLAPWKAAGLARLCHNQAVKSEVGGEERLEHGPIEALVYAAAAQTGLSGICNMLESIAKSLNAYGCFLWQASDDSDLDGSPPNGSLFVMAHWFEDGRSWAFDGIELHSVVGQVAVTRKRRNVPNHRVQFD